MRLLDLFAGSGIGVAVHRLGWTETGVEVMPEAIQTRQKLGWETLLEQDGSGTSVADLPNTVALGYDVLAGGPPCQTFSMAGGGEGRANLDRVLAGIKVVANGDRFRPPEGTDPRTWLVLEPLRIALHSRPTYIMLEQVPTVRPVWDAYAEVLQEAHGYSVWTGDLQAEMYGVPQTRKRRILIARLDGKQAAPPVPTHSRYYGTDPGRMDPGVLPWVSMAEALGWGMTGRPYPTIACSRLSGPPDKEKVGGTRARKLIYSEHDSGRWVHGSGCGAVYRGSTMPSASIRRPDHPAPTIAFGNDAASAGWSCSESISGKPSVRISAQDASVLQSFPADHPFQGARTKQYLQIGNAMPPLLAEAILRTFL